MLESLNAMWQLLLGLFCSKKERDVRKIVTCANEITADGRRFMAQD
jgi:hypothetical protein